MTQAKQRFATFEEYLSYSSELEGRFQLIDGELNQKLRCKQTEYETALFY